MIRVKKGSNEFLVSKKAYEDTFKKLGYSIVDEKIVGVVPSAIPTNNTIEEKLIETERKENELKEDNNDVVTSKELIGAVGANIEEDFGFDNNKENELENKPNLYEAKLEALKNVEKPKTRR